MKALKYAAIAVGTLVLVAVLGGVALWMSFDPNDYKDTVQSRVRAQTGRELSLPGRISLSVYPDIALEFGPATLGNAAGFGSEPMLQLERARLGVKLRPLFSRRVEVSRIEILRPRIRLQVDASGRDNWSDISERLRQGRQAPSAGREAAFSVRIDSVKLVEGRLDYADARGQGGTSLAGLNLTTGELVAGQPMKLELGFVYTPSKSRSAEVTLQSTLSVDPGYERFQFAAPAIAVVARGDSLPQDGLPVSIHGPSLDINLAQQTLDAPGLQADIGGARLEASLQARDIIDAPRFSGTLALAELSPRDWLQRFGITPPVTRDPAVLGRFALRAAFAGSARQFELSGLQAQLDDTQLAGSAGISDFDTLAMRCDLQVNRLDADRYRPPVPTVPAKASGAQAAASPAVIPVELLRALNVRGSLRVGQAQFAGVRFSDLRIGLDAARGRLHLSPLEAGLYGGRYRGDISIDATALPRVSFNEQVTGVDFARLAKDWLETDKLSGRGNLSLKATASGSDSAALLRTLNGSLALKVDDGAFEGKDVLYEIRRARALLKQEPQPARTGPERTLFSQLAATATLANGVMTSNDLVAATSVMRVNGRGSVNLVTAQIDYRLDVSLLRAAEGRALPPDLADSAGLVVPVQINGPLADPKFRPDVEALVKALVRQKLDEKKQELEDRLRQQLGEKLKDLFGR